MMTTIIQVALGGAIGAVLRFGVGLWTVRLMGDGFPWGTLGVNVIGSFAMGFVAMAMVQNEPRFAPFVMIGILGGFTTFSAFSLDAFSLFERGAPWVAGIYVLASVSVSIGALVCGVILARSMT